MPNSNKGIINYGRIGGDASVHVETKHLGDVSSIHAIDSNVNIRSRFENSLQAVEGSRSLDADTKVQLKGLILGLECALAEVPEDHKVEVRLVTQHAEALATAATSEEPDRTLGQSVASGLLSAARALSEVAPSVLSACKDLVGLVKVIGIL